MNATRNAIVRMLKQTGLPVECGTGGRTKYNRSLQGYKKEHWLDAVCVGVSGSHVFVGRTQEVLEIKAMGRGSRQKCRVDQYGFPRKGKGGKKAKAKGAKVVFGFQTGDIVKALVAKGKHKGSHVGRVAVRASGSFNITTKQGTKEGISWEDCESVQKTDGYGYTTRICVSSLP